MLTPSKETTLVFIEVDDQSIDWWAEYSVSSDLLHGTQGFTFRSPMLGGASALNHRELEARGLREGMTCRIYVVPPGTSKPILQHTGRIEVLETEGDRSGAYVLAHGRDHMLDVVDSDVKPSIGLENVTFAEAARRILTEQFGFSPAKILVSNDANRAILTGKAAAGTTLSAEAPKAIETMKVDQAQPHAGETAYAFLSRHAKRFGLLVWGTADGSIIFGRPNYDQKPLYEISLRYGYRGVENTAIRMHQKRSTRHRAGEYHVYGHTGGGDFHRSPIHAVAYDDDLAGSLGREGAARRIHTVHDNRARTKAQAEERARYERSVRLQGADVIRAVVEGHCAADSAVYSIDTVASVVWDERQIDDTRYVIARHFRKGTGGTQTTLDIVPRNSIALGGGS